MVVIILMLAYLSGLSLVLGLAPLEWERRPRLQSLAADASANRKKKKRFLLFRKIALINKPLAVGPLGKRIMRDLAMAQVDMTPEEFIFIKEVSIFFLFFLTRPYMGPETASFFSLMSFVAGYWIPDFILKNKIKKIKAALIRELPDAIDLLGLCVNAGLDFMLALKWVVEKSAPSVLIRELQTMMQEINVGKTRREALKDLSKKYEIPDLGTFSRTLIQADKMGTSVAEALNILSEDMRLNRFRRGEQIALKAPLKMLVPLLLFIFPTVGVLIAGPIFLDFMTNNPIKAFGQ